LTRASTECRPGKVVPARWRADSALAFVALIWGSTFVVVKQALLGISTVYFLSLRFWLASLFMVLLFLRPFRQAGFKEVARGLKGGAIAGLFLWSGYMLQTFGLKYTTAGKSGFLTGLYIALVPVLGAIVYRRWPQASEILGILFAVIGMAIMTLPSLGPHSSLLDINKGDLLTIGCAVAFSFHLLILGYYSQRARYEAVALGQILCAAILSTVSLLIEPPRAVWNGQIIFALGLTSLFATALAFAFQTWGQQYTTATRTALIFALEPVFALVTAVAVGGETLTFAAMLGGTFILGGILLVELKPIRERGHPSS
jgi:drug/metabolite transporter (DMT)-like permease